MLSNPTTRMSLARLAAFAKKQITQVESADRNEIKKGLSDMKAFIRKHNAAASEFDEALVHRLIKKVVVFDGRFVTF